MGIQVKPELQATIGTQERGIWASVHGVRLAGRTVHGMRVGPDLSGYALVGHTIFKWLVAPVFRWTFALPLIEGFTFEFFIHH